jgi:hypothetical protein
MNTDAWRIMVLLIGRGQNSERKTCLLDPSGFRDPV